MPINMFFIVKNHWEPYFMDNLPLPPLVSLLNMLPLNYQTASHSTLLPFPESPCLFKYVFTRYPLEQRFLTDETHPIDGS
jgi:hypothetical protein